MMDLPLVRVPVSHTTQSNRPMSNVHTISLASFLTTVFFTIFSQIFEFELGNPGFGTSIDFATGLGLFLRMSTGAVVVGALFAAGLLIMVYLLDRKFNYEESIVQVSASITAGTYRFR